MTEQRLVLSVHEAAALLDCSPGLIYSLIREERMPGALRLGVKRIIISRAVLEAWVNGKVGQESNGE